MSLPDGAVFAPGARDTIERGLKALAADPHAPREVSVNVILHLHYEFPKHVKVGEKKVGEELVPITKIVNSAEEEAATLAELAEPPESKEPAAATLAELAEPPESEEPAAA